MRDIRSDLRERLDATVKQRMELVQRLRALEVREQRLRALLQDEEASPSHFQPAALPSSADGARLRAFVLGSLADGRDWSLEDLKEHAQAMGVITAGAGGRSLNITLVTLLRKRQVERLPDGRWRRQDGGSSQLAPKLPVPTTAPDQEASEQAPLRRPA